MSSTNDETEKRLDEEKKENKITATKRPPRQKKSAIQTPTPSSTSTPVQNITLTTIPDFLSVEALSVTLKQTLEAQAKNQKQKKLENYEFFNAPYYTMNTYKIFETDSILKEKLEEKDEKFIKEFIKKLKLLLNDEQNKEVDKTFPENLPLEELKKRAKIFQDNFLQAVEKNKTLYNEIVKEASVTPVVRRKSSPAPRRETESNYGQIPLRPQIFSIKNNNDAQNLMDFMKGKASADDKIKLLKENQAAIFNIENFKLIEAVLYSLKDITGVEASKTVAKGILDILRENDNLESLCKAIIQYNSPIEDKKLIDLLKKENGIKIIERLEKANAVAKILNSYGPNTGVSPESENEKAITKFLAEGAKEDNANSEELKAIVAYLKQFTDEKERKSALENIQKTLQNSAKVRSEKIPKQQEQQKQEEKKGQTEKLVDVQKTLESQKTQISPQKSTTSSPVIIHSPSSPTKRTAVNIGAKISNPINNTGCQIINKPIDDNLWNNIKEKVIENATKNSHRIKDEGDKISIIETKNVITRNDEGVNISSNENPPDIKNMVENLKIAQKLIGVKECEVESVPNKEVAADIIIELAKEPYPVKPIFKEAVLKELKESKDSKCIQAMEIYNKMHLEYNQKKKPT